MDLSAAYRSPTLRALFAVLALTGLVLGLVPPESARPGAAALLVHVLLGVAACLALAAWWVRRRLGHGAGGQGSRGAGIGVEELKNGGSGPALPLFRSSTPPRFHSAALLPCSPAPLLRRRRCGGARERRSAVPARPGRAAC